MQQKRFGAQGAQILTSPSDPSLVALQDTPSGGDRYLRTTVYDIYANDQWRLTPRISLTIGCRLRFSPPADAFAAGNPTKRLPSGTGA